MSVNITILPSDARTDYARHCLASYGAKFLDSWGNFPEEGVVLTGIPSVSYTHLTLPTN